MQEFLGSQEFLGFQFFLKIYWDVNKIIWLKIIAARASWKYLTAVSGMNTIQDFLNFMRRDLQLTRTFPNLGIKILGKVMKMGRK